ncbi:carbonic anhydrase [Coniochaeta sp. 2T2.1]|nr:carbonic anhydrase [Coniochaeta sp. 2T2.1]
MDASLTVPQSRNSIPSVRESQQQVLWIGCSDSSFEEITCLGLRLDETIVLRSIGNIFLDDGLTCLSMVQYAIGILQVKHVVVCGHYGCGLVKASSSAGLTDPWLSKLNALRSAFDGQLSGSLAVERDRRFVELNVLVQMQSLQRVPEVASAVGSRDMKIHGFVYDHSLSEMVRLDA